MKPPDNRYLRRSSVSVPREQRTAWQVFRLVLECVFVVVLLMGIAASIYAIYQRLSQQNFFPLKRVIIQEPLRYGDMREVSEIIRNHHQRDLLHMDVTLLADEMQRLDWIAKASVYKRWPDAVEVKLEERVPVVRWGGRAFLDASGEPFSIPDNDKLRELATIHGPDGYEKQVLQYWHDIAPWLGARQLQLQQLSLDQRLVWHAELENGLDVILGRDQLNDRLKKLAVVNDKVIKPYHRYIEAIDLRYHDGFSVRWKAGVKPVTAEKNPARDSGGIVKTVTVVKETPAVKETAKPAAKPAAVAKEKTAAKPAPKEPSK
ncbi:cell division protein FtsQ/DivIB [Cardiobacterium hominis]|nr:cell division protein FtsQ/DivIB [Cardiobacterium hominis]